MMGNRYAATAEASLARADVVAASGCETARNARGAR
jgi:hypothetical protein